MKNVLVYINPSKEFVGDSEILSRIQIDNSFDLGYNKDDIILVTNFKYEYNGIRAIVVDGDSIYYPLMPRSTNTLAVPYLIENGITSEENLYWMHDFDAYQMNQITKAELELNNVDLGLTNYGWSRKWCLGSFFYKPAAIDVFQWIKNTIYEYETEDERALTHITRLNYNNINSRYKALNITYNFGMRRVEYNYSISEKPIRVVHFHPSNRYVPTLDIFMYGKNEMNTPILNERLIKIFNKHGVK